MIDKKDEAQGAEGYAGPWEEEEQKLAWHPIDHLDEQCPEAKAADNAVLEGCQGPEAIKEKTEPEGDYHRDAFSRRFLRV